MSNYVSKINWACHLLCSVNVTWIRNNSSFLSSTIRCKDRDSVFGIATCNGLNGSGLESRCG